MRRPRELPEEYQVPRSSELDFQRNPRAALQYVAGGFAPNTTPRRDRTALDLLREEAETPSAMLDILILHLQTLREAVDAWKKSVRPIAHPAEGRPKLEASPRLAEKARAMLEQAALETVLALKVADERLRDLAQKVSGADYLLYLGMPSPMEEHQVAEQTAVWRNALAAAGAMSGRQDPDTPQFAARTDLLVEEISESLRQIARHANWLWTNEPEIPRLTTLMEWAFDLRAECLEVSQTCACLKTPFLIWRKATPEPATNGETASSEAADPDGAAHAAPDTGAAEDSESEPEQLQP